MIVAKEPLRCKWIGKYLVARYPKRVGRGRFEQVSQVSERKITFFWLEKENHGFSCRAAALCYCVKKKKIFNCSFSAWLGVEESWSQEQGTWKGKWSPPLMYSKQIPQERKRYLKYEERSLQRTLKVYHRYTSLKPLTKYTQKTVDTYSIDAKQKFQVRLSHDW